MACATSSLLSLAAIITSRVRMLFKRFHFTPELSWHITLVDQINTVKVHRYRIVSQLTTYSSVYHDMLYAGLAICGIHCESKSATPRFCHNCTKYLSIDLKKFFYWHIFQTVKFLIK